MAKTMKRYRTKISILYAVAVNIVMLGFFTLCFNPTFEVADDAIMSTILYGGYGYLTPYCVFQNIILTKIITKLILWFPGIAWYTMVQTLTVFTALIVITYLVMEQNCKKLRAIVWTFFLMFVWYDFYVQMQFTKTAAIASIAGLLMVYRLCQNRCKSKFWTGILAFGFCSLGIMWRSSAFGMVFLVMFVIGLVDLLSAWKKNFWKKLLVYVIGAGFVVGLYWGFTQFQTYTYNRDPQWQEYLKFNGLRAQLVDCGWPEYGENEELYNSLGITDKDIDLYDRWNYGDPEIFTMDALEKLNQVKEETDTSFIRSVRCFAPKIWRNLNGRSLFVPWLILAMVSLLLQPSKSKWYVLYSVAVTFGLGFYFLFVGRGMLNRLDASILCANGVILSMLPWEEERIKRSFSAIVAACVCVGLLKMPYMEELVDYNKENDTRNDVLLMNSDQQSIYYTEEYTVDAFEAVTAGMWECPEVGIYSNISRLGGWKYPSPDAVGVSTKYGITNPYRQMVDNPNVYLVCNKDDLVDKFESYIQRHYNKKAKAVKRKELATASVYQIVTKTPKVSADNAVSDDAVHGSLLSAKEYKGELLVQGELYRESADFFSQKMYLRVVNTKTGKATWHNVIQYANEKGEYVNFKKSITIYTEEDLDDLQFEGYLEIDGKVYKTLLEQED